MRGGVWRQCRSEQRLCGVFWLSYDLIHNDFLSQINQKMMIRQDEARETLEKGINQTAAGT